MTNRDFFINVLIGSSLVLSILCGFLFSGYMGLKAELRSLKETVEDSESVGKAILLYEDKIDKKDQQIFRLENDVQVWKDNEEEAWQFAENRCVCVPYDYSSSSEENLPFEQICSEGEKL